MKNFNKDDLVCDYKCEWTDQIEIEKNVFDLDLIKDLIIEQCQSIANVEALFDMKNEGGILEDAPPAYVLAGRIGLPYYEWVSADYMDEEIVKKEHIIVVE